MSDWNNDNEIDEALARQPVVEISSDPANRQIRRDCVQITTLASAIDAVSFDAINMWGLTDKETLDVARNVRRIRNLLDSIANELERA